MQILPKWTEICCHRPIPITSPSPPWSLGMQSMSLCCVLLSLLPFSSWPLRDSNQLPHVPLSMHALATRPMQRTRSRRRVWDSYVCLHRLVQKDYAAAHYEDVWHLILISQMLQYRPHRSIKVFHATAQEDSWQKQFCNFIVIGAEQTLVDQLARLSRTQRTSCTFLVGHFPRRSGVKNAVAHLKIA